MKQVGRFIQLVTLVSLVSAAAACGKDSTSPQEPAGVDDLRTALAPYSSLNLAKGAGYTTALTDCMSNGDQGAMGIHYANVSLLDAVADSLHPEALIYEPGTDGQMSLVGVEFIIPYTSISRQATPPTLFGQSYSQNDIFGVWALHVWTHRANPSGLFAPWNPRVHC